MSGPVVGEILNGTYRLSRVIGQGGMGVVFEAAHLRVPRRFAIKVLGRDAIAHPALFERFQREAEIASALGSEHIAQVFDFNVTAEGTPYMVLELLEGEDLAVRLERGAMSLADTIALVEQVSRGLERAHSAGIVHRDLKPSNLFVCRRPQRSDLVKILDFGISKVLRGNSHSTRSGTILGTPSYMAPEQALGHAEDVDQRTDIFAFGAIIYECLTGRVAFEAPSEVGTIYQVCNVEPTPVRELAPELPRALERVIGRALSKQRERRYGSARELCDDFARACSGLGPETVVVLNKLGAQPASGATPSDRTTTLSSAAGAGTAVEPTRRSWYAPHIAIGTVAVAVAVAFTMWTNAPTSEPGRSVAAQVRHERDAGAPTVVPPVTGTPIHSPDAGVAAASDGDASVSSVSDATAPAIGDREVEPRRRVRPKTRAVSGASSRARSKSRLRRARKRQGRLERGSDPSHRRTPMELEETW